MNLLIKNIQLIWAAPLAMLLSITLLPGTALAFERQLLIKMVPLPIDLPQDSYLKTSAVASPTSPLTTKSTQKDTTTKVSAPAKKITRQPLTTPLVLEGEASYYSRAGCLGCNPGRIMANGQPLNDAALTIAIGADKKHLVGRKAMVTNLNTGQSVEVRITDTGGFYQAKYGHRVADLTIGTKQAIGINGGTGQVRVEVF